MGFYPDDFPIVDLQMIFPDQFFLGITLAVALAVFIKDYIGLFMEVCSIFFGCLRGQGVEKYPRVLCGAFLAGAWVFVYVCLNMSYRLEGFAANEVALFLSKLTP
jgi:hypothetical protein